MNKNKLAIVDGLISRYEEIAQDYKKYSDENFVYTECWMQACIVVEALKNYRTLINSIEQCSKRSETENNGLR